MIRFAAAVLVGLLPFLPVRAAELPETPAGQRLGELLALIDQATPETVGDLFNFAEALKSGALVSKTMAETLTTGKPELDSAHYGYGFGIHPERVLYGHSGGFVGISANLDIVTEPEGWVIVVLANDDSMRAPVIKSRQLIGVVVPE